MRFICVCACLGMLSTAGCAVGTEIDEVGQVQQASTDATTDLCSAAVSGEMVQSVEELTLKFGENENGSGLLEARYSMADGSIVGSFEGDAGSFAAEGQMEPTDGPFWSAQIRLTDEDQVHAIVHLSISVHDLDMVGVALPRGWVECGVSAGDSPYDTDGTWTEGDGPDAPKPADGTVTEGAHDDSGVSHSGDNGTGSGDASEGGSKEEPTRDDGVTVD